MREKLIAEGRAARIRGLSIDTCPRFRFEDMSLNWRMGWRWQDQHTRNLQEIRKRRSR